MSVYTLPPSITPSHNIIHILPAEVKNIIFNILLCDGKIASALKLQEVNSQPQGMRTTASESLLNVIKAIETNPANAHTHIIKTSPEHTHYPVYLSACHNAQQFSLMDSKSDIRLSELALQISEHKKTPEDKYVVAVLQKRMQNNTFSFSTSKTLNMDKALQLIPSVGKSAREFAVRRLCSLKEVNILNIATMPTHVLYEDAKNIMIQLLDNNQLAIFAHQTAGNVGAALDLIPHVGSPATKYVTRHLPELKPEELIQLIALDDVPSEIIQHATKILDSKFDQDTMDIKN